MTGLLLLGPGTPMLFQGQEFGASSPFYFFADHRPDLAELVHKGRQEFMSQFRSVAQSDMHDQLAYPSDPETFQVCKLDFSEREKHSAIHALHRDLLALRRKDPVFSVRDGRVDGAVLGAEAFVLRYFAADGADRLLVVNFGRDLHLNPAPEPLLAPPENSRWETLWSSEDTHYEGGGWGPLDVNDNWHIPGEATVALAPRPWRPEDDETEDDKSEDNDAAETLAKQ